MGVLPLVYKNGTTAKSIGLKGDETFTIKGAADMTPRKTLQVKAVRPDGTIVEFEVTSRLDTEVDVDYYMHGGILPFVLRKLMKT